MALNLKTNRSGHSEASRTLYSGEAVDLTEDDDNEAPVDLSQLSARHCPSSPQPRMTFSSEEEKLRAIEELRNELKREETALVLLNKLKFSCDKGAVVANKKEQQTQRLNNYNNNNNMNNLSNSNNNNNMNRQNILQKQQQNRSQQQTNNKNNNSVYKRSAYPQQNQQTSSNNNNNNSFRSQSNSTNNNTNKMQQYTNYLNNQSSKTNGAINNNNSAATTATMQQQKYLQEQQRKMLQQQQQAASMIVEQTAAQKLAAAKVAVSKQLEQSLQQLPSLLTTPYDLVLIPPSNHLEYTASIGLEAVVNHLLANTSTTRPPQPPKTCGSCGTDHSTKWMERKDACVCCESCYRKDKKKLVAKQQEERIGGLLIRAGQQEKSIEKALTLELQAARQQIEAFNSSLATAVSSPNHSPHHRTPTTTLDNPRHKHRHNQPSSSSSQNKTRYFNKDNHHSSTPKNHQSSNNSSKNNHHSSTKNHQLTSSSNNNSNNSNNNNNGYFTKEFILHQVLHFDSTRKKMSVLIEERSKKGHSKYKVICKGADSSVLETVTNGNVEAVKNSVNWFAKKGYRTLVYAYKHLSQQQFLSYNQAIHEATMQLENRNDSLLKAYSLIETDLTILGSTAIEDQLQNEVPQTISALRSAGIQVWVLTGDKQETAECVSSMAGHLTPNMVVYLVTEQTERDACYNRIITIMDEIKNDEIKHPALIVDGNSLTHAIFDNDIQNLFMTLCCLCSSVLGCRLTPIQKAQVVKMVKTSPSQPITAAVGDGANDVSMLHEAHVGIGIMGKEGKQAARAADIAICSFFHLRRIFLVHGQYFYTRLATCVLYFFYKNVVLTGCQILFTFHNAISGQTYFTSFYLLFYNQTFTALPVLLYGIFEKHIPESVLHRAPVLYRKLRKNRLLNKRNFIKWNVLALFHSIIAFYGVILFIHFGHSFFSGGWGIGFLDAGCMTMMVVVLVVNIKLMLVSYYFNIIMAIGYTISIVMYYVLCLFNDGILTTILAETVSMHWTMFMLLSAPAMWFLKVLLTTTSLLPDITLRIITDSFNSSYIAAVLFKSELKNSKMAVKDGCLVSVKGKGGRSFANQAYE